MVKDEIANESFVVAWYQVLLSSSLLLLLLLQIAGRSFLRSCRDDDGRLNDYLAIDAEGGSVVVVVGWWMSDCNWVIIRI